MNDDKSVREMTHLMHQSATANGVGESEKALELLERAIQIGESTGVDVTQARIRKEILLANKVGDLSGLVATMEDGLELYVSQNNIVERINMLVNLIGCLYHSGQYDKALEYTDQAENLIDSLTPKEIGAMKRDYPAASSLTVETFIDLRLAEVRRLRKVIARD